MNYFCQHKLGLEFILSDSSNLSYPWHNHFSNYTLGLILVGSICLTTLEKTNIFMANQTFILAPHVSHKIEAQTEYSMLTVCIHKDLLAKFELGQLQNLVLAKLTQTSILPCLDTEQIQILVSSLAHLALVSEKTIEPSFYDLAKKINIYPENKFRLEDMAQTVFRSKYSFIRRFTQELGLTPHQFQMQNRIRKAQYFISHSGQNLTEVALSTGFCDQSHFIKQFKKVLGISPSEYKRACKSIGQACQPCGKVLASKTS